MKRVLLGILYIVATTPLFAQATLLQSGPMVGYSDLKEVALWVQTTQAAEVKIKYWPKGNAQLANETQAVNTGQHKAFATHLLANKLEPGKTYEYELYINKKKVAVSHELSFQSQPLWQWRTDAPNFKLALGSCAYISDSIYDRPGTPYGGDYSIFTSIKAKDPDAMLWLGDNTYLREADWNTESGIYYRYTHTRSIPQMQPLLGSTHNYAIWDDHDYGPNDADRSYPLKHVTLEAFNNFWANPNTNVTGKGGITGTFTWSDAQVFLLDDRWFRSPNNRKTGMREMMGTEQFEWLIDALTFSRATFKFIAIGNQVINDAAVYENMATYKEERAALIKAITDENIPGVIFLTGDRHQTELSELKREGTYPLRDLTVSPLTASANKNGDKENNTLRVPNTFVGERNFAVLEFTGKRKERVVTIIIYNTAGTELWRKSISESELK